jgi:hypothetical protein
MWAKSVAQQPKQPEHNICICAGIGHDFGGVEFRLLLQHHGEKIEAVA